MSRERVGETRLSLAFGAARECGGLAKIAGL